MLDNPYQSKPLGFSTKGLPNTQIAQKKCQKTSK